MEQNKYKRNFRLLEPAIIITLVTGTLYMIGYVYHISFFSRLSLPDRTLILPTAIYLREAILYCLLFLMIGLPSFIGADKKPRTFLQALRGNLLGMTFAALGIIYVIRIYSNWVDLWRLFLGPIPILVISLVLAKRRRSMAHLAYRSSWLMRGWFATSAVAFTAFLAITFGEIHATKVIEGTLYNSMVISLEFKDGTNFQEGKELILIMYHNGKYYIVERQHKAPKYPSVHIISDTEIAVATIKRIK